MLAGLEGEAKGSALARGKYEEASIRVLKGLQPVKERPGMYTRTVDPTHIVQEVIDNAADEALAGSATRIDVWLHADHSGPNHLRPNPDRPRSRGETGRLSHGWTPSSPRSG